MILHTLNSGLRSSAFQECLRIAAPEDAILLTGDGVYAAVEHTEACAALLGIGAELFVLAPDAHAAGITQRLAEQIISADYDDFVALTERFERQMAWY